MLLKDCCVFGAAGHWGKRSGERNPGNIVSELSTKYLLILGYKLYFIIPLFSILYRKEKSNLSSALQNLPV